jgi:hypothetical protein
MSDHELLVQLAGFLAQRNFITMDDASLSDMVKRYQNPPLTGHNRVAMQMTVNEYNNLAALLTKIENYLKDVNAEWARMNGG